jgi:hypothetical protein
MDIQSLRQIVDSAPPGIAVCENELNKLYDYVELEHGSSHLLNAVSDTLYKRIRECFTSGHAEVWRTCRSLQKDLIRYHVFNGGQLDPYFEVIDHLRDAILAIRSSGDSHAPIIGDWEKAIRFAYDHVQLNSWGNLNRERLHARDFNVAKQALFLRNEGYAILLESGKLGLSPEAETALISSIEDLVATIGGVNVARRIFKAISPCYDVIQQRYHVVRQVSMYGDGESQIPWGYMLHMAVKHAQGRKPYHNTDVEWDKLCNLLRAYAAITDVQPYTPTFFATLDAIYLIKYLQEMALYDTLFCIPQLRPTDAVKLARGMFDWLDTSNPTKAGWSVDQVLEIIDYILNPIHDARGPIFFEEKDIRRKCPSIPSQVVTQILNEVLSHPEEGANQKFTRPTDAPIPQDPTLKDVGHDFFLRPLLRFPNRRYVLLDRSVCASACIESLLTPMRLEIKGLDDKIGAALEKFLVTEFASHGVKIISGDYDAGDSHGECDVVVETPDNVIFIETKKKTLTRRAKAGYQAYLLLDLASSLVAAQVQAGWHEVRLRRDGHLDLKHDGIVTSLELKGRGVERVAVSMFDYGSFQDRTLLKQFIEASINATFTPVGGDSSINKKYKEFNESLVEMREQVMILNQGDTARQPFFNCWFLSVPHLLLLLDGVSDGSAFKTVLWSTRHIITGNSDFYADLANMRKMKETVANKPPHLR